MKKLALIFTTLMLSGCFDDTADLSSYIATVKVNTIASVEPMPKVSEFDHFDYSVQALRSPFDAPKPEAIQEKIQQMTGCLSPDPERKKQPLEKFALNDLTMRGTLGEDDVIWALIEASDASLTRVTLGSYLGLYNGHITSIGEKNVKVTELIPDGIGCWVERETIVTMVEPVTERQRK